MRIGFVLTNLAGGGAEKAVLKIAQGLAERAHRVDLITVEERSTHGLPEGLRLHVLTPRGRAASKGWVGRRIAAYRLARLLGRLAEEEPFRLLVSTLPFADEVALRAGAPALWCRIANTLSAEVARLELTDAAKARRRMARYRALYGGKPLIAVSQGVADDLRGAAAIAASRIEVIPNPFDFAAMRAQAAALADRPQQPYVIHVGRFAGQKRHDLLLDAFARLRIPHRLVLLADAAPVLTAMIAARGLGGRVEVVGFQANPYPWIAGARLLVLCSDHEGLPNVLIEALALGVPVVSTDCPSGPREVLGAGLAEWLVPCGDAAALAAAMERALTAPPDAARADLGRYAKERVVSAYERLALERA